MKLIFFLGTAKSPHESLDGFRRPTEMEEIKQKVKKEISSQNNKRTKVAILDYTDFQINDKFEILRSRSNKNFRNKIDFNRQVNSPFSKPKQIKNTPK